MFPIKMFVFILFIACGYCETPVRHNLGIIGGHKISIEKVPYIASLRLNGTVHWCGSSIIHERFILTAAHCIVANRTYKVLVGTDEVDKGGRLYDVEKILIHEMYSNITNDYDICILKLNESLSFGAKVNKIALNDKSIKLKRGMLLDTAGWGYTQPNGTVSANLREVKVPLVPWLACQFLYGKVKITHRMVCAGGRGKDSCMGDSGGPLTFNGTQVGVTSFGSVCGELPGIYTKVSIILPWIKQTIQNNL